MLHFAYDGSIHGDWVAFYAIRVAARMHDRTLRLLHVTEGGRGSEAVFQRVDTIAGFCHNAGVQLSTEFLEQREDVTAALPRGRDTFVLSGTRSRSRRGGFLAGTVAEKLLNARQFQALAVRVVQPGLLGWPRDVLVPVAGHPQGFRGGRRVDSAKRASLTRGNWHGKI